MVVLATVCTADRLTVDLVVVQVSMAKRPVREPLVRDTAVASVVLVIGHVPVTTQVGVAAVVAVPEPLVNRATTVATTGQVTAVLVSPVHFSAPHLQPLWVSVTS